MGMGVDNTTGYGYINCAGNTALQPLLLQSRGGYVGIGTTNPQYQLDVSGGTGTKIHDMYINAQGSENMLISSIGIKNSNNVGTGFALYQGKSGDTVLNANSGQPIDFKINNATKMRLTSNGYVGIGNAGPSSLLDISVNSFYTGTGAFNNPNLYESGKCGLIIRNPSLLDNNYANMIVSLGDTASSANAGAYACYGVDIRNNYGWSHCMIANSSRYSFKNSYNFSGTEVLTLLNNGYVGIGATNPGVPLAVHGYVQNPNYNGINTGTSRMSYFYQNGAFNQNYTTANPWVTIYATNYVWSGDGFLATSDNRIKTNIIDINANTSLEYLRKIKPKKFNFIDCMRKGTIPTFGFIAQDIKEVLPNSVSNNQIDYIPNIYELVNVSTDGYTITLNNKSTSDISLNYLPLKIRFFNINDKPLDYEIDEIIDDKTFTLKTQIEENNIHENQVFLYGQHIDDLNVLDKDEIFTLTTAAVKFIDTIVQGQQQTIETLQNRLNTLEARLDAAGL
jgi:hypothetical protein